MEKKAHSNTRHEHEIRNDKVKSLQSPWRNNQHETKNDHVAAAFFGFRMFVFVNIMFGKGCDVSVLSRGSTKHHK
jgi:hypothetical protein